MSMEDVAPEEWPTQPMTDPMSEDQERQPRSEETEPDEPLGAPADPLQDDPSRVKGDPAEDDM